MILYQIENLQSGRKVRLSKVLKAKSHFEWGCDCGSDGSFLTEKELRMAEKELNISYYRGYSGDCELHEYEVNPRKYPENEFVEENQKIVKKIKKAKKFRNEDELDIF